MLKYFACFIILWGFPVFAKAQKDSSGINKKELSEFDLKNYKSDPKDRLIFEINHTGWLGVNASIKPDWKSIGFNFSPMFDKPLGHSKLSVGYGLGIYCHNFSSNADFIYQLDSSNNHVTTSIQPKTIPYKANRYNERIVEIPLELRFRTKAKSQFKIMLGAKAGYVFSNYKKTDDADGKIRRYDITNVERLRYGVHFRIGIEQFCLTGCYYLSEAFGAQGPQGIHPFSIGLAIIPY